MNTFLIKFQHYLFLFSFNALRIEFLLLFDEYEVKIENLRDVLFFSFNAFLFLCSPKLYDDCFICLQYLVIINDYRIEINKQRRKMGDGDV